MRSASYLAPLGALALLVGCPNGNPQIDSYVDSVVFGTVTQGHPRTLEVVVENIGGGSLQIAEVRVEGDPGFSAASVLPQLTGLAGGELGAVDLTFDPQMDGDHTADLIITSTDPLQPELRLPVSAFANSSAISVDPGAVEFDEVEVGRPETRPLEIQSVGEAPLQLLFVGIETVDGIFALERLSVTPGDAGYVQPGEAAVVDVLYAPLSDQLAENTLLIISDDPAQPELRVPLSGSGGNAPPVCAIVGPNGVTAREGEPITFAATVYDDFTKEDELLLEWSDTLITETGFSCEGEDEGVPNSAGFVNCTHTMTDPGLHEIKLVVTDEGGRTCEATRIMEVGLDQPPTVTLFESSRAIPDRTCVTLEGAAFDLEDGPLATTWTSDVDGVLAEQPAAGELGFTELTLCDLGCGANTITLSAEDSRGQVGTASVEIEVLPQPPELTPVGDQGIVEGQTLALEFTAAGSCGEEAVVTWEGEPEDAAPLPNGFAYTPVFTPEDNPVGEIFTVTVHAELPWGSSEETFQIEVLANEFAIRSSADAGLQEIYWSDYDGELGSFTLEPLAGSPVGVVDIDTDGDYDIIVRRGDELQAALRQPDGSFSMVGLDILAPNQVTFGDFDGDGRVDIASYDALLLGTVWLNRIEPGGPPLFAIVPVPFALAEFTLSSYRSLAIGSRDANGDGRADIYFSSSTGGGPFAETWIVELLSETAGPDDVLFGEPNVYILEQGGHGVVPVDADADGDLDLVVGYGVAVEPGQALLWRREGAQFVPEEAFDTNPGVESGDSSGAGQVSSFDWNHDGCPDLLIRWQAFASPTTADYSYHYALMPGLTEEDGSCRGVWREDGNSVAFPFQVSELGSAILGPYDLGGR